MVRFIWFSYNMQTNHHVTYHDQFILCFPQFSALYPEMVDTVILLDTLGFIPTDPVICIFLLPLYCIWQVFLQEKKHSSVHCIIHMPSCFSPVRGFGFSHLIISVFCCRKKYAEWWDWGWIRCFSLKKTQKRQNEFTLMRRQLRGIIPLIYSWMVFWISPHLI